MEITKNNESIILSGEIVTQKSYEVSEEKEKYLHKKVKNANTVHQENVEEVIKEVLVMN